MRSRRADVSINGALGFSLAAALILFAFVTTGGVDLGSNTWAEIVLVLIGIGSGVAVLLWGAQGPAWGGVTLALFAAVTAFTAISIAWSVQPDNSWVEANRAVSYLAVFGGAIALARLVPERWPALIGSIATLATALSAWALLVKVFPATLDPNDLLGRVKAPFDYWNAVGLIAGLGLPACLWAGSRREGSPALRALCAPAITILITTILLSYSRSALLAAIVGAGLWFVLVPVRLRAAATLALGATGSAALTVWALATHPLTRDGGALSSRTAAGHSFGLVLALVLAVVALAGFAAAFMAERVALAPEARRRIGTALICALAIVPLGGVVALAASSRGLTGGISHVWSSLTNSSQVTGDVPGRLVELANSRPRYWGEALKVGEHAPLKGVGAGGYGTARGRYTTDQWIVEHAHSYAVETFADFGLIGVVLNLALLAAWALASARTLGVRLRGPTLAAGGSPIERPGLFTLLCVVVVFGVSSAIDWTWFVPGTAVPALLCAGWVAGRGPTSTRIGRRSSRRQLPARPVAIAALTGATLVTIVCLWAIWQPLRSANADTAAVAALSRGDAKQAITDARAAAARDPVSVEPLWELSAIFSSVGNEQAARAELVDATRLQPENPATWQQLGFYDLRRHDPGSALPAFRHALSLDRGSVATREAIKQVESELPAGSQTT